MLLTVIASIPVAIWAVLLFGRGGFWRVSKHLPPLNVPRVHGKRISVVIPARNERDLIGSTVQSLLAQSYEPPPRIFVVDDNSSDDTAATVLRAAEQMAKPELLTLIRGKPLPSGWSGKLWAMSQGIAEAERQHPDYLLLTDADIAHAPDNIVQSVSIAEAGSYDLTSFMVRLACASNAEKAAIPAFVFFFFMLYPPAWIASRNHRTAGAAGGCMLIRVDALRKIGGLNAIRNEVIDDCALARAVKDSGGSVWLGLTPKTTSTREYGSFGEIGRMISRTAFNQLHHSTLLLAATIGGLLITYLVPVAMLVSGRLVPALLGGTAFAMMTIAYLPMVRFYRRQPLWALSLPLVAMFYLGATMYSAVSFWRGKGGSWKGRVQDARGDIGS